MILDNGLFGSTRQLHSWKEFKAEIALLSNLVRRLKTINEGGISDLLFRGQKDENWKLETTLERGPEWSSMNITDYRKAIFPIFEEHRSQFKNIQALSIEHKISKSFHFYQNENLSWFSFMAFLRHEGFPSPLLDWTTSPEIAAFFAFQEPGNTQNVVIFTFLEFAREGKYGWTNQPQIHGVGPRISGGPRHIRQKGQYTFCVQRVGEEFFYRRHEDAFKIIEGRPEGSRHDLRVKFLIPASEREAVLQELATDGICNETLFPEI